MGRQTKKTGKTRFCNSHWSRLYVLLLAVLLVLTAVGSSVIAQPIPAFGPPGQNKSAENTLPEVKIEIVPQYNLVTPGQSFALAITLDVPKKWHLYANPKQGELGIDTEIIAEPSPYFQTGRVIYPAGELYEDKNLKASNHIYEGKVTSYVPVKLSLAQSEKIPAELPVTLRLSGLLCGSTGTCLPWDDRVTTHINVTAEKQPSATIEVNRPELFTNIDIETAFDSVPVLPTTQAQVSETLSTAELPDYIPREISEGKTSTGIWLNLLFALIAGALLNLMPCVLPVIPLKVLSILQQSQIAREGGDKYKAVKLSLVFAAGILLVFVGLAIAMSVFQLLYGQQFQSNAFKFVMLMIIFLLSLSMMGLFEVTLPGRVTNINIVRQGYLGALGMGILATLLATPCSAPLLGPVLAWSLNKPTAVTIAVFLVVGIGMASPYVLLTAFPKLLGRLPKAGNWMIRLKEGLGFVMLAVAAYLIFLFPAAWQLPMVGLCLVLAFCVWLSYTVVNFSAPLSKRLWARGAAVAILAIAVTLTVKSIRPDHSLETQAFSIDGLIAMQNEGRNIMVEVSADWCPNCKFVEKTVLNHRKFTEKLVQNNITFVKADWTHKNPEVTMFLNKLGSKSIPFAVVFSGRDPLHPVVLRDIYTLNTALKALDTVSE